MIPSHRRSGLRRGGRLGIQDLNPGASGAQPHAYRLYWPVEVPQQEWALLQNTTQSLGTYFQPVYTALCKDFLLALFLGGLEAMPSQKITGFMTKQVGLAILDPTQTVHCSWKVL